VDVPSLSAVRVEPAHVAAVLQESVVSGLVPLALTSLAPDPCRYIVVVLAGFCLLRAPTDTERVKAAPYDRKPGWVGLRIFVF
jgi:hypothetical protein